MSCAALSTFDDIPMKPDFFCLVLLDKIQFSIIFSYKIFVYPLSFFLFFLIVVKMDCGISKKAILPSSFQIVLQIWNQVLKHMSLKRLL